MKSNVRIAAGIAIIILGLLVILTPRYLFPVCEDEGSASGVAMAATMTTDDMGTMTTSTDTTTGTMTGEMDNEMDEMDQTMDDMDAEMDDMEAEMDMGAGPAPCHYTSRGALLLGLLIMLAGVAMMLATSANAARLLALVTGGLGAAVILLPTYFLPICESPQMQCHDGSEPLLIVLGALVIVVAAVVAAMAGKDRPGMDN